MPSIFQLFLQFARLYFLKHLSPGCLQFSSHVCHRNRGRFNFQLIFAPSTTEFDKTTPFYLQTETLHLIKKYKVRKIEYKRENTICKEVLKRNLVSRQKEQVAFVIS